MFALPFFVNRVLQFFPIPHWGPMAVIRLRVFTVYLHAHRPGLQDLPFFVTIFLSMTLENGYVFLQLVGAVLFLPFFV